MVNPKDFTYGVEIEARMTRIMEDIFVNMENGDDYVKNVGEDCSIEKGDWELTHEIRTKILTYNQLLKFFDNLTMRLGKDDFSKEMNMNWSCGLHLHIGTSSETCRHIPLYLFFNNKELIQINQDIKDSLNQKKYFTQVINNYYREYATKILETGLNSERHKSINISNRNNHETIELRSFNGNGLTRFSQIKEMYVRGIKQFVKGFNKMIKTKQQKQETNMKAPQIKKIKYYRTQSTINLEN